MTTKQQKNRHIKRVKSTQAKQVIPVQKRGISDRTKRVAICWLAILIVIAFITPPEFTQSIGLIALASLVISS